MKKITETKYRVIYYSKQDNRFYKKHFYKYDEAINFTAKKNLSDIDTKIYQITETRELIYDSDWSKDIIK